MKISICKKTAIISSGVLLCSCAVMSGLLFHPDFNKFRTDYKAGEYDLAIADITPKSDTPDSAELKFDSKAFGSYAVIAGLEAGTAALTAGKLEDSTKYLDIKIAHKSKKELC